MNAWLKILTAILVVQLLIIAAVTSGSNDLAHWSSDEGLIGLVPAQVKKLSIVQPEQDELLVEKRDGKWILLSHFEFPASEEKVTQFIDKLAGLKRTLPVGQTAVAAKQFKVQEDNFERKLSFEQADGQTRVLYVGTTPGFKKVHARVEGEDAIVAAAFSSYEASTKPSDWHDSELLKLDQASIQKVAVKDLSFELREEKLVLSDLAEDEEMVAAEQNSLLSNVSNVRFEEVLGKEEKEEFKLNEPVVSYTLETKGHDTIQVWVGGPYKDTHYVLKTSQSPYFFKVNKAAYDKLKGLERKVFVKKKEVGEPETENVKDQQADLAASAEELKTDS